MLLVLVPSLKELLDFAGPDGLIFAKTWNGGQAKSAIRGTHTTIPIGAAG